MKIPLIVPPLLIVRLYKIKFRWYINIGALLNYSKFELKFDRLNTKGGITELSRPGLAKP